MDAGSEENISLEHLPRVSEGWHIAQEGKILMMLMPNDSQPCP